MKINRRVLFLSFLGLVQLGFFKAESRATPKELFLVPVESILQVQTSRFEPLLSDSKTFAERKKILYLINQVRHSPYRFVRNGSEYSGTQAAAHLQMKYTHAYDQIRTARDFIIHIASHSMMTDLPYGVITLNGQRYPAQDLLFNELERLEKQTER